MVDVQSITDLLSKGIELYKNHMPPDRQPNLTLLAGSVVLGGLVMSLWGGRLLRMLFVAGFMVAGAVVGIKIARIMQVDDLVGLVLGVGFLGVIGYLLYRWWLGMTAGLCVGLVVAVLLGPGVLPAEIQKFEEQRLGGVTGEYVLPPASSQQASPLDNFREYMADMWTYFLRERSDLVYRTSFALGLAWLMGLLLGVVLPRFTTILGTALIGTLGLGVGIAMLLSMHVPVIWSFVSVKAPWFLGALGVFFLGALSFQARHGQPGAAPSQPGVG